MWCGPATRSARLAVRRVGQGESVIKAVAAKVAEQMTTAALAWLDALSPEQRTLAAWPAPGADAGTETERQRWFYTPTDHGGLTIGAQRPAQQQLAHKLVATGLSEAAYNTVSVIMGLENVLDRAEDWGADWGRERGRDPGMYYLRVFGDPGGPGPWGWRYGGHHVSLNNLIVDGTVVATTPCFLGADPANSALLGPARLRPLAGVEDLARELMLTMDADLAARATLLDRAPADLIGGNRARISDGDTMIYLRDLWRQRFTEPRLAERIAAIDIANETPTKYDAADYELMALTDTPKGLPARDMGAGDREILRALLGTYFGRVPNGLGPSPYDDTALDAVYFAWAGTTEFGGPHYYRLQGPRLLVEFDNTQRGANHAHSVWRDPEADFGHDVLAEHRAAHHGAMQ
jgi:hypothetical protein